MTYRIIILLSPAIPLSNNDMFDILVFKVPLKYKDDLILKANYLSLIKMDYTT